MSGDEYLHNMHNGGGLSAQKNIGKWSENITLPTEKYPKQGIRG